MTTKKISKKRNTGSNILKEKFNGIENQIASWAQKNLARLFIYEIILMSLVLLHSLGYFHPFFVISAHFIIIFGLVLSVVLLRTRSNHIALFCVIFWLGALIFESLQIIVWAERLAMYAYETLLLCTVLIILENIRLLTKNLPNRRKIVVKNIITP